MMDDQTNGNQKDEDDQGFMVNYTLTNHKVFFESKKFSN